MRVSRVPRVNIAFTLIELLIVVAIIAILAAIAVPNFLEAQTRSKVSRVKSDLRTLVTGLESYFVDNRDYPTFFPNHGVAAHMDREKMMTTPIPYLTTVPMDPFRHGLREVGIYEQSQFYIYEERTLYDAKLGGSWESTGNPPDKKFLARIFGSHQNPNRAYILYSFGPDGAHTAPRYPPLTATTLEFVQYDPSNGTISMGNIMRTSIEPSPTGISLADKFP